MRKVREIDCFAIVFADQFQRVFQYGHHSESKQIHLHDVHIRAIVFVPLHNVAAGHGCRLEWNDRIQLALANHHAAGMLPEMPWQVLKIHAQLQKFADPRLAHVETRRAELRFERVGLVLVFKMPDEARQPIECRHI